MIVYVYFKESKIISCKIDNIEYISDNDKEIKGNNNSVRYGDSQDYICLTSDGLNLNVGDTISIDGLTDERSYFSNKEQWYQDKITSLQQGHEELKQKGEDLQCFSLNLQYQIDTK